MKMILVELACSMILPITLLSSGAASSEERGHEGATFARSGGIYAGGAADGVFGTLNTFRAHPDTDINDRLRMARDKGLFNVVQLSYEHHWNGDPEESTTKLSAWLERTDLSLVDVVHLSEEQPYNAASWLDPLYDVIKAHEPSLPVYVWPTFPLGPIGKADGYVYDAYGEGYMASRKRFMPFLRTGKPLIMCVDASGYSDYRLAREQVMVCHELDIPVFYFVADSGKGSYNNWYGKSTAALSACRNFMFSAMEFQRRCREPGPITAGDLVWGDQIELAPDTLGDFAYEWSEFGAATVYGFTRLDIYDGLLSVSGAEDVILDYQFWSLLPVEDGRLVLSTDKNSAPESVQVAYSRCGKPDDWRLLSSANTTGELTYDLADLGTEFRLRVTLADGAALRGGRLVGRSAVPEVRSIDLNTYYDGWRNRILFHQNLDVGLWRALAEVDVPEALLAGPSLALRGRKGRGVSVAVVERFHSEYPLKDISVRLNGMNHSALGGSFALGVSLDGKSIQKTGLAMGERRSDGLYQGAHVLDLSNEPDFQDVQTLYVHMIQKNGSGIEANTSSRLDTLEIDATRVDHAAAK
jgi:hypothetical protein